MEGKRCFAYVVAKTAAMMVRNCMFARMALKVEVV